MDWLAKVINRVLKLSPEEEMRQAIEGEYEIRMLELKARYGVFLSDKQKVNLHSQVEAEYYKQLADKEKK